MSNNRHLLIVIDPTHNQHLALERFLDTAKKSSNNPKLSLLFSIDRSTADLSPKNANNYLSLKKIQEMLAPLDELEFNYQTVFCWADEWQRSVINYAKGVEATMIMIPDYSNNQKRNLFSDARWDLLRKSPCPVSIIRPTDDAKHEKILIAVNAHANTEERKALNARIIDVGNLVKNLYNSDVHVVSAYPDSMNYPDRAALLNLTNAKSENIHVAEGSPEEVVPKIAKEIEADVVVIGTMRKNGLKEKMRGQLAERLLQRLDGDVMTVN